MIDRQALNAMQGLQQATAEQHEITRRAQAIAVLTLNTEQSNFQACAELKEMAGRYLIEVFRRGLAELTATPELGQKVPWGALVGDGSAER